MTIRELKDLLEGQPDSMEIKKYCYTGEYNDPWIAIGDISIECTDWRGKDLEQEIAIIH